MLSATLLARIKWLERRKMQRQVFGDDKTKKQRAFCWLLAFFGWVTGNGHGLGAHKALVGPNGPRSGPSQDQLIPVPKH